MASPAPGAEARLRHPLDAFGPELAADWTLACTAALRKVVVFARLEFQFIRSSALKLELVLAK